MGFTDGPLVGLADGIAVGFTDGPLVGLDDEGKIGLADGPKEGGGDDGDVVGVHCDLSRFHIKITHNC